MLLGGKLEEAKTKAWRPIWWPWQYIQTRDKEHRVGTGERGGRHGRCVGYRNCRTGGRLGVGVWEEGRV